MDWGRRQHPGTSSLWIHSCRILTEYQKIAEKPGEEQVISTKRSDKHAHPSIWFLCQLRSETKRNTTILGSKSLLTQPFALPNPTRNHEPQRINPLSRSRESPKVRARQINPLPPQAPSSEDIQCLEATRFFISFSLDSLEVPEQPRASQSQDPKDTNCRFVVSSVVSLVLLPETNFKVHAKPRARTQKTGPTCYRKPVAQFSDARLMYIESQTSSNEFREHMYIQCSLVLHARQSPRGKFQKRSVRWLSELHTAVLKGVVLRKHSATVWDAYGDG